MASNLHLSAAARDGMLNTLNTALGSGGFLRFYSGTQPATADTALSGNTQLAQLTLAASPFGASSSGTITAAAIGDDVSADATGTATFASFVTSAGVRVLDVSVGTAGADINLNTVSIVVNALVRITSYTLSLAA